MANDEFEQSAEEQVRRNRHDIEEGHGEQPEESHSSARGQRIVLRVSNDEMRRIKRFYEKENMPVSTAIRSLVLNHIRKAR